MCGRYTRQYTWPEVHDFLNLVFPEHLEVGASYNVAPTQTAPVARLNDKGELGLVMARWGLIPSWAKDHKIGASTINARAETAATKPAFRSAFKARRCVVPVSGFYEWKKLPAGGKQPMYIYRADGASLLFAGLWERWNGPDGEVESFSILTTGPNEFMGKMHDRMPAILEPERVSAWLDPKSAVESVQSLLVPAADGVLAAHSVSPRVNSPKNNDASCIETTA